MHIKTWHCIYGYCNEHEFWMILSWYKFKHQSYHVNVSRSKTTDVIIWYCLRGQVKTKSDVLQTVLASAIFNVSNDEISDNYHAIYHCTNQHQYFTYWSGKTPVVHGCHYLNQQDLCAVCTSPTHAHRDPNYFFRILAFYRGENKGVCLYRIISCSLV